MAEALAGWHDFFVTAAQIAGVLLGLLFVAISIRRAGTNVAPGLSHAGWRHLVMNRFDHRSGFDALATQTYVIFVYALGAGLIMLVPQDLAVPPAIALVLAALLGLVETTYPITYARRLTPRPRAFELLWRYGLPEVSMAALLVGSVLIVAGEHAGADVVAAAEMLLLFGGARNTWDLFLTPDVG